MSKEYLEALKRIRQETCPATYMADFDKNECCDVIEQALKRLEAIDNAEPSEALEDLIDMIEYFTRLDYVEPIVRNEIHDKFKDIYWHKLPHLDSIKEALLKAQEQEKFFDDKLVFKNGCIMSGFDYKGKQIVAMPLEEYSEFMKQEKAQEPKQYLKWEDLEFKKEEQTMKVLLNGERYLVKYVNEWFCGWCNRVQITNGTYILCTLGNGMNQFFNNLHLEVVEE